MKQMLIKENCRQCGLIKLWKTMAQYQVAQNYITLYKEKYPSNDALKFFRIRIRSVKNKNDLDRRFKWLMEKERITFLHI